MGQDRDRWASGLAARTGRGPGAGGRYNDRWTSSLAARTRGDVGQDRNRRASSLAARTSREGRGAQDRNR